MSLMSVSTLGWGTIGAIAIGAAAVSAIMGSIASVAPTGDLGIDPNGGPVVASPTMGGIFQGKKGDGLSMGPGFGVNGGGGGDTAPLANAINSLKDELKSIKSENRNMRSDMAGYFGFGGTAVKGIGKETSKSITGGVL